MDNPSKKKPIPLYFIAAWFFLFFTTMPYRYKTSLSQILSENQIEQLGIAALIISFIIVFKFIQCDKLYISIVFWSFLLVVFYLFGQLLWIATQHWSSAHFNPQSLFGLTAHILCIGYLSQPTVKSRIASFRDNFEKNEAIKFQKKLLNKR